MLLAALPFGPIDSGTRLSSRRPNELLLSTRESPYLRDHMIPLGVTAMSAGSKTEPGGYTQEGESAGQFEISDHRSPGQIADMIRSQGYEPVWKDWDSAFIPRVSARKTG